MGNLEDPLVLAALLSGLVDSNPIAASAARSDAQTLLQRTPVRDFIQLEQEVRLRTRTDDYYGSWSGTSTAWRKLDGRGLFRASLDADGACVVCLASFHSSGFVREEAVRLLANETRGDELPFLLLRANDWVAAVQRLARQAIETRLVPAQAESFLRSYFLVQNLASQRRNDLAELHRRIVDFLRSAAVAQAREAALLRADRKTRRALFVLASDAEGGDLRALVLRGLASDDLWLRVFSARTARTRLYGPALREVLGQARGDRSTPVRREALLGFVEEYPELRKSLLDPSASLREMVRYYLRKKANLDFATIYREELSQLGQIADEPRSTRRLITALAGLGETGSAEDAEAVEMFTIDARPRVRRTALLVLGRLDAERRLATLGAALADESPRVARAALAAIGSRLTLLGKETLERTLHEQKDARCKEALKTALQVFRS